MSFKVLQSAGSRRKQCRIGAGDAASIGRAERFASVRSSRPVVDIVVYGIVLRQMYVRFKHGAYGQGTTNHIQER